MGLMESHIAYAKPHVRPLLEQLRDRILSFEMPVNIAINLPNIHQMCHFFIVNTTQKSVDKSVEQRIVARISDLLEVEEIPSLPRWILNTVTKGEIDKAIRYVDYLNEAPDSPWRGKIAMANDMDARGALKQSSFVAEFIRKGHREIRSYGQ